MPKDLAGRIERSLSPDADHVALREQASAVLRSDLGFDLAVWATVDPATVMWTSCVLDGAPRDEDLEIGVFTNEYGRDDVMKLADLAQGDLIGTLHGATGGDPTASARYREVFAPRGFTDELRLVFHDGTTPWGALNLLRSSGTFSPDEVESMRRIIAPFARALRGSLLRTRAQQEARTAIGRPDQPEAPDSATFPLTTAGAGLVLCDRDGRVIEISDAARALLGTTELPAVVTSLVAANRSGTPVTATAPRSDGQWLTFQTAPLGGQVAVVVERIRPGRMADLVVRGRGLSGRERQVLEQLVQGRANKQIARTLGISEWTVQDHVKAVLAKFGVSSRSELVSAVFFDHYVPLHAGLLEVD